MTLQNLKSTLQLNCILLLSFFVIGGCSTPMKTHGLKAQFIYKAGEAPVGAYISSTRSFDTNSYWIEGPDGLIAIDTQFLLPEAEQFIELAEKTTGKKVKTAIVLHPNPDKFNGTSVFKKRGIEVITSEQVRKLIPAVHELRKSWFYERFKPDYPADLNLPDSFGAQTTELKVAGLNLKLHVLGAGCSEAHVVVEYEGHIFTGDLIHNGYHAWLEIGKIDEWLKRLEDLRAMKPRFVYPGRGLSGDSELIDNQEIYLTGIQDILKKYNRKKPLTDKIKEQISDQITERYPSYMFPLFATKGLPALWK